MRQSCIGSMTYMAKKCQLGQTAQPVRNHRELWRLPTDLAHRIAQVLDREVKYVPGRRRDRGETSDLREPSAVLGRGEPFGSSLTGALTVPSTRGAFSRGLKAAPGHREICTL